MGCAAKIVKYLFIAFNLIFWILGIVVFAIGIYSRVENDSWKSLLDTDTLFSAANLLIAAGVIVAIIGFFGCCGAYKQCQWMLGVYCALVILIFILEIAAGAYAYTNKEKVENELTKKIKETVASNYGENSKTGEAFTKAVDWFQQNVECCGVSNSTDWATSKWRQFENMTATEVRVPDSCCKKETSGCGKGIANYNDDTKIYTMGCVDKGKDFAKKNLYLVGGVGVGIAIVELLAIVFGVCLICSFKEEEKGGTSA